MSEVHDWIGGTYDYTGMLVKIKARDAGIAD